MLAIKSVEVLDTSHDSRIVSLNCDKVLISPNEKITLIDYDTGETKTVYRYNTLVYKDSIFKTCEMFSNNHKFDIDITKVIGYCNLSTPLLKPCSKKLYKILDCIERIDVLTDGGGIIISRGSMTLYDENNIFGHMHGAGDFDVSDLLTISSLVDNDRLNKMIDEGIIYMTNGRNVVKVVLVKDKNIRRLITKLVTMNSNNPVIRAMMSESRMRNAQKSMNFGIAYGMGAVDLASKMFGKQVRYKCGVYQVHRLMVLS